MSTVFITGATGYISKRLTKQLLQRGHGVIALVRKGSENKVVACGETVVANPFDPDSFHSSIPKGCICSTARPFPSFAKESKTVP